MNRMCILAAVVLLAVLVGAILSIGNQRFLFQKILLQQWYQQYVVMLSGISINLQVIENILILVRVCVNSSLTI